MIKYLLQASMLILPGTAFAFFCPTNFQDIQMGDTKETVLQKCGQPASQKEVAAPDTGPQEWIFNVTPTTAVSGQGSVNKGSVRMSVMLQDNKILNIFANGMSMPSTTICGTSISVGTTADQLKAACGMPTMVNKGTPSGNAPAPSIEMLYNSRPPVTLIFQDGKLTGKKEGASGAPQFTTGQ